jgi:putative transcriptional regulator
MSNIKSIRRLLGVTQQAMADGLGCTQANVSLYEKGQALPPDTASRLIAYAKSQGQDITFDDVYAPREEGADTSQPQPVQA